MLNDDIVHLAKKKYLSENQEFRITLFLMRTIRVFKYLETFMKDTYENWQLWTDQCVSYID